MIIYFLIIIQELMKEKLLLLTERFPYGKGEKTFIIPEIELLSQNYDITIVTKASDEEVKDTENNTQLDSSISVVNIGNKVSLLTKIKYCLLFFFDKDGQKELREILTKKEFIAQRVYQSLTFYILAMKEYAYVKKLIKGEKKVIGYSFWFHSDCYCLVKCKRKYRNIQVISRAHGYDLYNERCIGNRQPFKKILDKNVDKIVFASQYAFNYYLDTYANKETLSKYEVHRLCVPKCNRKNPKDMDESMCIVSCSRVIPIKRVQLIIDALALINDVRIKWIHIGEGVDLKKMIDYSKSMLDRKKNLEFEWKGYLSPQAIRTFYETTHIDCFISTSSTEGGCPLSIQEAMSFGIPIIGTSVGGITEMIHENGILLNPNPIAKEIADAIMYIYISSDKQIERMRKNSYDLWESMFNANFNTQYFIDSLLKMNEVWN